MIAAAPAVEAFRAGRFAQDLADAGQKVADHVVVGARQKGIAQGRAGRLELGDTAVVGIPIFPVQADALPPVARAGVILAPGVHVEIAGEQDPWLANKPVTFKDLADGSQPTSRVPVFCVGIDHIKGPALDLDGGGDDGDAAATALGPIAVDAIGDGEVARFDALDAARAGVDGNAFELVASIADDGIVGSYQTPDLGCLVLPRTGAAGQGKAPLPAQPGGQDFLEGDEVGAQGLDVAGQALLDVAAAEFDDVGPAPGRGVSDVD